MFSLASAVGEGTIPQGSLDEFETPALVLYLELPGPWPGLKAYHKLLEVAGTLVEAFDAELLDDSRGTMNEQSARLWQDRIAAFDAKHPPQPAAQDEHSAFPGLGR